MQLGHSKMAPLWQKSQCTPAGHIFSPTFSSLVSIHYETIWDYCVELRTPAMPVGVGGRKERGGFHLNLRTWHAASCIFVVVIVIVVVVVVVVVVIVVAATGPPSRSRSCSCSCSCCLCRCRCSCCRRCRHCRRCRRCRCCRRPRRRRRRRRRRCCCCCCCYYCFVVIAVAAWSCCRCRCYLCSWYSLQTPQNRQIDGFCKPPKSVK